MSTGVKEPKQVAAKRDVALLDEGAHSPSLSEAQFPFSGIHDRLTEYRKILCRELTQRGADLPSFKGQGRESLLGEVAAQFAQKIETAIAACPPNELSKLKQAISKATDLNGDKLLSGRSFNNRSEDDLRSTSFEEWRARIDGEIRTQMVIGDASEKGIKDSLAGILRSDDLRKMLLCDLKGYQWASAQHKNSAQHTESSQHSEAPAETTEDIKQHSLTATATLGELQKSIGAGTISRDLRHVSHSAFPHSAPELGTFQTVMHEIASRLLAAAKDDLKGISLTPQHFMLCGDGVFAAAIETASCEIFFSRRFMEALLSAPEMLEESMSIDALAGVIAHELAHVAFRRQFNNPPGNSMVQEEWCDVRAAKMMEGAGFKPKAMPLMLAMVKRTSDPNGALQILDINDVHASIPIRSELYEKASFDSFERDRIKEAVQGLAGEPLPRSTWLQRLQGVVEQTAGLAVVSPINFELQSRLPGAAGPRQVVAALAEICSEYRDLLRYSAATPLLNDICSKLVKVLGEKGVPREEFRTSPELEQISETLWHSQESAAASWLYNNVLRARREGEAFAPQGWGLFAGLDAKVLRFVTASSGQEVTEAMRELGSAFEAADKRDVRLTAGGANGPRWLDVICPSLREAVGAAFKKEDFDALCEGAAIPLPFAPHLKLQSELESRPDSYADYRQLSDLMRVYGITDAIKALLSKGFEHPVCKSLRYGAGVDSLDAFSISEASGIALEYPRRLRPYERDDAGTDVVLATGAWVATEQQFALFQARQAQGILEGLATADSVNSEQLRTLVQKHGELIAPQVYPVGAADLPELRASHAFAKRFVEMLSEAAKAASAAGYERAVVREILLNSALGLAGKSNTIYCTYLHEVTEYWQGPRVDPEHPLVRYMQLDPDRLFTPAERLMVVVGLNGLDNAPLSFWQAASTLQVLSQCLGSEEQLQMLLGVNTTLAPEAFAENLTRVPNFSFHFFITVAYANGQALIEARSSYIVDYLRTTKPEHFSLAALHTLADLCGRVCGWQALDAVLKATEAALSKQPPIAALESSVLLDRYQRLVAMGAIDRSPDLQESLHRELERRYDALSSHPARQELVKDLLRPRFFESGDYGYISLPATVSDMHFSRANPSPSSAYTVRMSDPRFEHFLVRSSVECFATSVREATGAQYDDGSKAFSDQVETVVSFLDKSRIPSMLRAQILQQLADELLTQAPLSEYLRSQLGAIGALQDRSRADQIISAAHSHPLALNAAAVQVHNALLYLRDSGSWQLRGKMLEFLLMRAPSQGHVRELASELIFSGNALMLNIAMGDGRDQRLLSIKPVVAFHLNGLHQRFSQLGIRAKGALLATLATDSDSPEAADFSKFNEKRLFPAVLAGVGKWEELLKAAINDYFEFYGGSIHQKFMVACSILAGAGSGTQGEGDLASVGRIARLFLGAHGPAGYKMLQRLRNYPDTPQAIKDELFDVLDNTVKYPRWMIHEMIAKYGPPSAGQRWVGRAKAGSMCLSVELKDGAKSSFLSIIHPGAHADSQYWLGNFVIMGSNLGGLDKRLSLLAPMASQAKALLTNECEFANAPRAQQEVAEQGYTYQMRFPHSGLTVRSQCAALLASEAKPDSDFMKSSGNKEVQTAVGRPLLELIDDFRTRSASGELHSDEQDRQFSVLQAAAFAVVSNEIRLMLAGRGKDHDRHPGNYLIEIADGPQPEVRLTHFDFGCTDIAHPSVEARSELRELLRPFVGPLGLLKLALWPNATVDSLCKKLFNSAHWSSLPQGLHASLGAKEVIDFPTGKRQLLSQQDLLRAFKVALDSGDVAPELSELAPRGIFGLVVRGALKLVDVSGAHFLKRAVVPTRSVEVAQTASPSEHLQ